MKILRTAVVVFLLCFVSGCKWLETISRAIQGAKGTAEVQFLVMIPVSRIEGPSGTYQNFDAQRTRKVRDAIMNGIRAAGDRYKPLIYENDKSHSVFYNAVFGSKEQDTAITLKAVKRVCANWVNTVKSQANCTKCEAILFGWTTQKGENATADPYVLNLYDVTTDNWVQITRSIPFNNDTEFKERLEETAKDLVVKAYQQ